MKDNHVIGIVTLIEEEKQVSEKLRIKGFVITPEGEHARPVYLQTRNDKIRLLDRVDNGDRLKVFINVDSKQSTSGSWYTHATAWKIENA